MITPRERRALVALAKRDREALLVLSDLLEEEGNTEAAESLRMAKLIADAIWFMVEWESQQFAFSTATKIRRLTEHRRTIVWRDGRNVYRDNRFPMPEPFRELDVISLVVRPATLDMGIAGRCWYNVNRKTISETRGDREAKVIAIATILHEGLQEQRFWDLKREELK